MTNKLELINKKIEKKQMLAKKMESMKLEDF
jgi:hypothetical protein